MVSDDTIRKTICRNIVKYRKLAGLSQKEFAQKLGAAPSRVSSWETGANSTDIDTLFQICKILNISINAMCEIYPDSDVLLSYVEQDHIRKYRDLDPHGREMVDFTLLKEWERSTSGQNQRNKVVPLMPKDDPNYVNAAHAIEGASEEDKQHDEDIMNDENF